MQIDRTLTLKGINISVFLFGPRQAGKTWLLKKTVNYNLYIDLLKEKERGIKPHQNCPSSAIPNLNYRPNEEKMQGDLQNPA